MGIEKHTYKSKLKSLRSECLLSPIYELAVKRILFITMVVTLASWPHIAHASCGGDACSSFGVESKSYSSSDTMAKATLVNKDQSKKMHLKGCVTVNGKCGSADSFDVTIEAGKRVPIAKPISSMLAKPAEAQNFVVDVNSAEFLQEPANVQQQGSAQQGGLCPYKEALSSEKGNTCCCDRPFDDGAGPILHDLICMAPSACTSNRGKCVTNVTSCRIYQEARPTPKPAPPAGPTKPVDIKVSVVNGESEPLLITLRDADSNVVIADHTLWNSDPFAVTLNNKGGKGHLKWAASTIPAGLSTAFSNFAPWDGASQYAVGANVVLAGDYYRAIKASQHVMPPNAEYWQQLLTIDKSKPGAKPKCGEGDVDNLATGAKVVLKVSRSC
jgi:hypothetical protein